MGTTAPLDPITVTVGSVLVKVPVVVAPAVLVTRTVEPAGMAGHRGAGVPRVVEEAPVAPEAPEVATGLETAPEVASPVSPVLVALDRTLAVPEAPLVAVGP